VFNQKLYIFGVPSEGNKDSNLTIGDLVTKMTEPASGENFEEDNLLPRFPICYDCFAGKDFSQSGIN
jgi:hypothetical protein